MLFTTNIVWRLSRSNLARDSDARKTAPNMYKKIPLQLTVLRSRSLKSSNYKTFIYIKKHEEYFHVSIAQFVNSFRSIQFLENLMKHVRTGSFSRSLSDFGPVAVEWTIQQIDYVIVFKRHDCWIRNLKDLNSLAYYHYKLILSGICVSTITKRCSVSLTWNLRYNFRIDSYDFYKLSVANLRK